MKYIAEDTPLVVLAGSQYGTGSSRDWAAKGTLLLGVKAVITTSFERIHRSNLVGMGVLPLCFEEGQDAESLGLDGTESFDIPVTDEVQALQELTVTANKSDGSIVEFTVDVRLDTPVEVDYYRNGGILHTVLRNLAQQNRCIDVPPPVGWDMQEVRGYIRSRFRSEDDDVDVLLEGEADWVRSIVAELGLRKVGWAMPMAISRTDISNSGFAVEPSEPSGKPKDMGPEPDPSRIPVVRRPIGELDLAAKLVEAGLEHPHQPSADELREQLQEIEEPHPAQGTMVIDPIAESWLKELLRIVVRNHGVTAISTETIALAASDFLGDREGMELELFLESMFRAGKLVKVHGGNTTGWGPSPAWLASGL